jgi:hypothetical protein
VPYVQAEQRERQRVVLKAGHAGTVEPRGGPAVGRLGGGGGVVVVGCQA